MLLQSKMSQDANRDHHHVRFNESTTTLAINYNVAAMKWVSQNDRAAFTSSTFVANSVARK